MVNTDTIPFSSYAAAAVEDIPERREFVSTKWKLRKLALPDNIATEADQEMDPRISAYLPRISAYLK
jgi:hypothetical protein